LGRVLVIFLLREPFMIMVVKYISYDTTSVNRVRPVDIKGHADILIEDNELDFDAP
jgi:hypothetical protein